MKARIKLKRLKEPEKKEQIAEKIEQNDWIKNPVTGLIWENVSFGKKMTWNQAFKHCKSLDGLERWNRWQPPSPGQARSLVDSGLIGEKSFFGNKFPKNKIKIVEDELYWTSYELTSSSYKHLKVAFNFSKVLRGSDDEKNKDSYLNVICVLQTP